MEAANKMNLVNENIYVDWIFDLQTHCDLFIHSTISFLIFHHFSLPVTTSCVIDIEVHFFMSIELLRRR